MEVKKDIDIKGLNVVVKNEVNIKVDGNVNVVLVIDSRFYVYKEINKGKFGKLSLEELIVYVICNVVFNIIGDKVNIISGKDINFLGSNI